MAYFNFSHPSEVDQIDLAPTLSYLLSVPFPGGSTGQILPQVTQFLYFFLFIRIYS